MKLAIVGSMGTSWPEATVPLARGAIAAAIQILKPEQVISGRCPKGGVDIWAIEIATLYGVPWREFPPFRNSWEFYKMRDKQIAEACDELVSIRSFTSKTYGSGWTADYAEEIGKKVYRITL